MKEKIDQLKAQAAERITSMTKNLQELDEARVQYLGKKGELTALLRGMKDLSKEDRPKVGKIVNEARAQIEALIAERKEELQKKALEERLASEKIDVTLPGRTAAARPSPSADADARAHQGHLLPHGLQRRGRPGNRARLLQL